MGSHKLDKDEILHGFQGPEEHLHVVLLDYVSSTNDVAKQVLRERPENLSLIVTNRQTAGRGRSGKSFYSELEHGLYFTLALQPNTTAIENIPLYTILAATALTQTLEKFLNDSVQIKWVNDLFYQGKKVSGILSEMVSGTTNGVVPGVVIGIGLNISGSFSNTDDTLQSIAGTLFGEETPDHFNQNQFLSAFLNQFYAYHLQFEERNFMPLYEKHLMGIGQTVHYTIHGEMKIGVIEGIDKEGHLLVRLPDQSLDVLYGQAVHIGSQQFIE